VALVRGRAGSVRDSGGGGFRSDPKRPQDTRACACRCTPYVCTYTRHICTSSRDHMRRCESCGDVRCSSASDVQQALPGGRDAAQCRRARSHCASMTHREQRASRSERVGLVAAAGDRCRCLRALLVAQLPSAARGARPALALVAPHSQALMMPQSMTRPSVINLSSETRSADVPHVIEGRTQL
jgi:hypothetical protein